MSGDGKDDYVYINMLDGSSTVWFNAGPIPSSGSAFQWNWQKVTNKGGIARGACIELANLYGVGRADYIGTNLQLKQASMTSLTDIRSLHTVVDPSTNKASTYL